MPEFFKPLFDEYQRQLDKGARIFLKEEADRVIAQTIKLTPVKTGTLRGNFSRTEVEVVNGKYTIEVTNNLEYALPVEEGHRTRRGKRKEGPPRWIKGFHMLQQGLDKVLVGFSERLRTKVPEFKETK